MKILLTKARPESATILFVVLLVSCTTSAPSTPAFIAVTPNIQPKTVPAQVVATTTTLPTHTLSTQPFEPSSTARPARSFTATPTLISISDETEIAATDFSQLPSLSEVVITNQDFRQEDMLRLSFFLSQRPAPDYLDATSEVDLCLEDCVKKTWFKSGYSTLSLTMVRTPSAGQAIGAVEHALVLFTSGKDDVIETIDEFSGSPDHDWNIMRWKDWGVATTRGSVFLLLEWHIDWERDIDGYSIAMELNELSQMQLQKLKDAGFPP